MQYLVTFNYNIQYLARIMIKRNSDSYGFLSCNLSSQLHQGLGRYTQQTSEFWISYVSYYLTNVYISISGMKMYIGEEKQMCNPKNLFWKNSGCDIIFFCSQQTFQQCEKYLLQLRSEGIHLLPSLKFGYMCVSLHAKQIFPLTRLQPAL